MRFFTCLLMMFYGLLLLVSTASLAGARSVDVPSIAAYDLKDQRCYLDENSQFCIRHRQANLLSPDGQWQAVVLTRYVRGQLHLPFRLVKVHTHSGIQQLLFSNQRPMRDLNWSPDGQRLTFTADGLIGGTGIYVMTADGSIVFARLGNGTETSPVWSPDGQWIAFDFRTNAPIRENIYKMRPDGTERQQLTFDVGSDYSPAWSPDGDWLAFVSNRDGNAEIYKMRADGSQEQRLTDQKGADIAPTWSLDGKRIAFLSTQGNQQYLYWMYADGSQVAQLTPVPHEVRKVLWVSGLAFRPFVSLMGLLLLGAGFRLRPCVF